MGNAGSRPARTTGVVLFGLLLALCTPGPSSAQSAPAGTSGERRAPGVTLAHTEHREITSSKIGQRYDLFVSLPPDYATSGRSYPVLYVLDGWHFALMAFLDFLAGSIIPFVERTYRTIPTDRALLGHSLGGLFALYAMEQRPGLFQRIVAASPARLGENPEIVASLDRIGASGTPIRLDVSMAEEESGIARVDTLVARLDKARLLNVAHRYTVYRGENHNSVRLVSFPSGLYWVYRPTGTP